MTHYLNVFFYDIYPYICATVFFLGSWLRYDYGRVHGGRHQARCSASAG